MLKSLQCCRRKEPPDLPVTGLKDVAAYWVMSGVEWIREVSFPFVNPLWGGGTFSTQRRRMQNYLCVCGSDYFFWGGEGKRRERTVIGKCSYVDAKQQWW